MFADAYEKASEYTWPVIMSKKLLNGDVQSSLAAFTIINEDGWFLTAGHIVSPLLEFDKYKKEVDEYKKKIEEINSSDLPVKQKRKKIQKLPVNKSWIEDISYWWGQDGATAENISVLPVADIAVGQLKNFDVSGIKQYPILKNPSKMKHSTSVCKLGFPFTDISATYDENSKQFNIDQNHFPIPRFPIDGIFTRGRIIGKMPNSNIDIKLIETSTPGLRGQSGGPIYDTNGYLWGIQSYTEHLMLGFTPTVIKGSRKIEEHQFLNVGVGVHTETLIKFLRDMGVDFVSE